MSPFYLSSILHPSTKPYQKFLVPRLSVILSYFSMGLELEWERTVPFIGPSQGFQHLG